MPKLIERINLALDTKSGLQLDRYEVATLAVILIYFRQKKVTGVMAQLRMFFGE